MSSDEINALVSDKCYVSMITDYDCVCDGRAVCSKRNKEILEYLAAWVQYVHFGKVLDRRELIRVAGLKRLAALARLDQFPSVLVPKQEQSPQIVQPPAPITLIDPENKIHIDALHPDQVAYLNHAQPMR